jgi:hypothetical protein
MDLSEFDKAFASEKDIAVKESCNSFVMALAANTPVDTGHAAAGWEIKADGKNILVTNDVPYIDFLNQGTSKQAPAYFVEKTALNFGEPSGTIVEYQK